MDGDEKPVKTAKKLSLQDIFMKLENLRLWDRVRSIATRGTVKHPWREPWGTAIPALYDVIEESNGELVILLLEAVGQRELADQVRLMLKDYVQIQIPAVAPAYVAVEHKTSS
jgi:hypothetical protein